MHKEQTSVAIADPGAKGECPSHGNITASLPAIGKLLRRLAEAHKIGLSEPHVCWEGGGCGRWFARRLVKLRRRQIIQHDRSGAQAIRRRVRLYYWKQ